MRSILSLRRIAFALILFAVSTWCRPAAADSTAYWSGTNAQVWVKAWTYGKNSISSISTYVNGSLIKTLNYAPGTNYVYFILHFDSTQWADGTTLRFDSYFYYTNSPRGSESVTTRVYNKAYVMGNNYDFQYGKTAEVDVARILRGINSPIASYTTTGTITANKPTVSAAIPLNTVFYAYTHASGGPSSFGDCYAVLPVQSNHYVAARPGDLPGYSVTELVNQKGEASVYPEYKLVFIDGCGSAFTSDLADAFRCTRTVVPNLAGRAFVGWNMNVPDAIEFEQFTQVVFQNLSAGQTLGQAVQGASDTVHPWTKYPKYKNARPVIMGDNKTTLRGVYLGSKPTQWFWIEQ